MLQRPQYNWWKTILIGGACSTAICSVSFSGSFIDSLISFPLGCLLVLVQILSVRNELYSNVFEWVQSLTLLKSITELFRITIATILSFLSAALASTHVFCYSAVASASIVLILPVRHLSCWMYLHSKSLSRVLSFSMVPSSFHLEISSLVPSASALQWCMHSSSDSDLQLELVYGKRWLTKQSSERTIIPVLKVMVAHGIGKHPAHGGRSWPCPCFHFSWAWGTKHHGRERNW